MGYAALYTTVWKHVFIYGECMIRRILRITVKEIRQ